MQVKTKGVKYCSCGGRLHADAVEHNKVHRLTFLRCNCGRQGNYAYYLHGQPNLQPVDIPSDARCFMHQQGFYTPKAVPNWC